MAAINFLGLVAMVTRSTDGNNVDRQLRLRMMKWLHIGIGAMAIVWVDGSCLGWLKTAGVDGWISFRLGFFPGGQDWWLVLIEFSVWVGCGRVLLLRLTVPVPFEPEIKRSSLDSNSANSPWQHIVSGLSATPCLGFEASDKAGGV
ncbi:hypothetical protein Patl1_12310 [Pistacia atlantica]|uniref:Uncharacterized protein n=1 Tax=Pistacia atlantica TaxID=434234 RepID=A0ACC1A3Q4_9ROSI|nr:hypothetical protein Patl1_12310 [Pistacia atlantica]